MRYPIVIRSLAAGAASGLRSTLGPVAVFKSKRWGAVLPAIALGELIADKLPVPSRTIPPALAVRALAGALAGAAIAGDSGEARDRWIGGVLGALAAIGFSYAGAAYRERASRYIPSVLAALVEDGVAISLARAVSKAA
jgi:uncharacterized membrane protein